MGRRESISWSSLRQSSRRSTGGEARDGVRRLEREERGGGRLVGKRREGRLAEKTGGGGRWLKREEGR